MADSWLTDGNCEECRRQSYCKKPCTKAKGRQGEFKRRQNELLGSFMAKKMIEYMVGIGRRE